MKKIHANFLKPSQQQLNSLLKYYQTGQYDDAKKLSLSITQEFPKHQFAWKVLGATLKQMGKINESLVASQKSVQLNPQDNEAHNNLGVILQELGRLDEAEISFKKAIALKPDYAVAHYNLGNTLKKLGRLNEAEVSYTQAIKLKPDYAEAHFNLGNTLQELGRLDKAEISFKKAIKLKPDYAEAHFNLGNTLQELGRLDEAEISFRKAIALKPDLTDAHNNLGNVLKKIGRLNEAEVSYTQVIKLKPDYAEAHNNLGGTLQELGRLGEALASYRQAITLKPDFVDGARNLVKLPVGQLDSDTLDLCEKIFRVPGDELEHKIKYFFFRGYLLKHRGLMEQSFNNFCKANKLKLEDIKDKVMVEGKQNIDHLVRIKKWVPNIPDLTRDRLKKIFIMGPSRSGKSYAEHVLRGSSNVKALYEGIRNTEILKNNYYEKDLCERLFQNLFSQSEAQLFHQQYKVVTSTNPESIFYSDYLMDMLPNTYFIIVKRDPRDISSEIFTNEYLRGNLYSHDPNDISKYLGVYNEICETVSLKIPNRFLTVNFEEIIKAPADFVDRVSNLVETKFEVKHLKRNIDSFKPESTFRNYYADMNKKYKS